MAIISFIDPVVLPQVSTFLFVFAVVFGLLTYSKVGNFDRKVNGAIALAIALFAMLYEPLVTSLTMFMPIAVGLLVILFFLAFVQKVLGGGKDIETFPMIVSLAIMLVLLAIFSDQLVVYLPAGINPENVLWTIGLGIVAMFFWLVYKTKEPA